MQVSGKVLICDDIAQAGIDILKRAGMSIDYKPTIDEKELISSVQEYQVIIIRGRTKLSKRIIDAANSTKVIARVGIGLDNVDIKAAEQRGIHVINASEAAMNSVAELTIGHMISLARNISHADAETKKGKWIKKDLIGTELRGKYLGIVGVGNIGRNVGRIARALRMNLIGYDVYPINQDFIKEVGLIITDLNTLVESSDFITCHVPLTPCTKHMFNAELFSKMKTTAYIVNTSRGEVIDENALYEALIKRNIAGAALDVFESEPPINKMLIGLPNVICTPHIGAQTREAQELASTVIAEKIIHIMHNTVE